MPRVAKRVRDVVVIGGGPGGSTLAALLARGRDVDVLVCERAEFPREHVGESLITLSTVLLERSGALAKLIKSDCWTRKAGAIFDWDPDADPTLLLFNSASAPEGSASRWGLHVNRAEFDQLLIEHAVDCGAELRMGVGVVGTEVTEFGHRLTLTDGAQVECKILVDASGRHNRVLDGERRSLSGYRNIAIWGHFSGGRVVESLDEPWNVFHGQESHPIANFSCEDGWFWYIPVPRTVGGRRVRTHSIGLVTDPVLLSQSGKKFVELGDFLAQARAIPRLARLIDKVELIEDKLHTATNYSMIRTQIANYDESWVCLGDAAFFVDPLFSSGVTLAMSAAFCAASMIRTRLRSTLCIRDQRDLWSDYDLRFRSAAETIAAMVDQWYHAIGRAYPDSTFAGVRCKSPLVDLRTYTIEFLLDLSRLDAALGHSISASEDQERWREFFGHGHAVGRGVTREQGQENDEGWLVLNSDVVIRDGVVLGPAPASPNIAYWRDPMTMGDVLLPLVPHLPCLRFERGHRSVPFFAQREAGVELLHSAAKARPRSAFDLSAFPQRQKLLDDLLEAEILRRVEHTS